jgi:hypothetical protein
MYKAAVEFRYVIDGREHVSPAETETSTSSYSSASKTVATYAPGTRHSILYNPANPQDMRFGFGHNVDTFFLPGILGLLGLVFTPLGAGLLFFSRSTPRRRCPSCGQPASREHKFCPHCSAPLPMED